MQSAIFIHLFRDLPMLQLPFKILSLMTDIDENLTSWRHRHAIMAHRLIGTKIGTGGSSGHDYLKRSTERNRAFLDLFNISTFLLPKSKIPNLPSEILKLLEFDYDHSRG
jgi:tryptophan 2,3-dioxygenase